MLNLDSTKDLESLLEDMEADFERREKLEKEADIS